MWSEGQSVGSSATLKEVEVLGVPITCLTSYEEAIAYIRERIRTRDRLYCVAINPVKVCTAQRDATLMQVVRNAGMHICDGIGTALAVRFLHGCSICRITGVQLFFTLVEAAEREGFRIFLLGASPESNEGACHSLLERHPNLKIVGRCHGYYDNAGDVVDAINATHPDILFVAMGSPKQEYWMADHFDGIDVPFVMGVGGTFDVASGKVKWAPAFFRCTGTEFVYRTCMQPWRLKYACSILGFVGAVLRERICGRSCDRVSNGQKTTCDRSRPYEGETHDT